MELSALRATLPRVEDGMAVPEGGWVSAHSQKSRGGGRIEGCVAGPLSRWLPSAR